MPNALVDAGPLIALFDKDDNYHGTVKKYLKSFRDRLITTWPVITEVMHMLSFNVQVQINFLTWIKRRALTIFELRMEHIDRMIELAAKYSDLTMDLADGSLIVTSELLDLQNILTLDTEYYVYRTNDKTPLQNLLSELI